MAAEKVLNKSGIQSLGAYIDRQQASVKEWVALRPILEVRKKETGYEGGGGLQEPWLTQTEAIKQLSVTLKEISAAARDWC